MPGKYSEIPVIIQSGEGNGICPESYPQRTKARNKNTKGFDMLPFRDPDIDNLRYRDLRPIRHLLRQL